MRMDSIDRYADGREAELRGRIEEIYRQAGAEIRRKIAGFLNRHKAKSERLLQRVEAGEIEREDYQHWLQGQVFQGERWQANLTEITQAYVDADTRARELVGETDRQIFRYAANQTARELQRAAPRTLSGAVSFDIYDQHTVDRLIADDPKMLPEWKINEPKDYIWNEKRVQNAVTQGIIQGESVQEIGARLTGELAAQNAKKMEMFARTAITGAHNAGRVERMKETEAMGVRVLKKWLAVHDHRTRDSHAHLDGTTAKPDESFMSDLGPIKFPGDPDADPANTYNCRCTLTFVYPDFD